MALPCDKRTRRGSHPSRDLALLGRRALVERSSTRVLPGQTPAGFFIFRTILSVASCPCYRGIAVSTGTPIMDASEMSAIGDTLMRIVTPDMSPKQLVKAARKAHPKASKKDIARAAFFRSSQTPTGTSARPGTCRRLPSRSAHSSPTEQGGDLRFVQHAGGPARRGGTPPGLTSGVGLG